MLITDSHVEGFTHTLLASARQLVEQRTCNLKFKIFQFLHYPKANLDFGVPRESRKYCCLMELTCKQNLQF